MTLRNFVIFTILAVTLIAGAPAFAADGFVGINRVTVYNPDNSSMPEITVQSCTGLVFTTEAEARTAADVLLATTREKAQDQAREFWGEIKDEQIKAREEIVFVKPAAAIAKGDVVFYRGLVAQGYVFKYNGESKLVYHSEVTAAFKKYDDAYQAARALAPVCKKNAIAKITSEYGVAASSVEMVSVTFDVDITDRDDANYTPRYRGMVVHGFSFKVGTENKYVQKAGLTKVFNNYNDAMHAARAMAEQNFKQGRAEIMAEYNLAQDDVQLLSVTFDVDLI